MNIGHDHWVYGNKEEIQRYKALREKGEPVKAITITHDPEKIHASAKEKEAVQSAAEAQFLAAPVHDTGNKLYAILSFFLPILGIIAGLVFRHFNYLRNYRMCKKGAIVGFIVIGVILVLFLLLLLLAVV